MQTERREQCGQSGKQKLKIDGKEYQLIKWKKEEIVSVDLKGARACKSHVRFNEVVNGWLAGSKSIPHDIIAYKR